MMTHGKRALARGHVLALAAALALGLLSTPELARARCGDGVIDGEEECDGSDFGTATCFSLFRVTCGTLHCDAWDCTINPRSCGGICGDGCARSPEECDHGEMNSDSRPNACRTDCLWYRCGDGGVDLGEECDQGAMNSDHLPNRCRTDCTAPFCGDGIVDDAYLEECDDGERNSDVNPNVCRADCRLPRCGDWVVDSGEECDDGWGNSDYWPNACRSDCTAPYCGDGIVDDAAPYREQCDLGPLNSDAPDSVCSTTCVLRACGNGVLEVDETCDDGPSNGEHSWCLGSCRPNVCGDGWVNELTFWGADGQAEVCDDGEALDEGPCRYDCGMLFASCGNGLFDPGEDCDAGAANSLLPNAPCRPDCTLPRCGDGVVDDAASPPEECDGTPGCRSDCALGRPGDPRAAT